MNKEEILLKLKRFFHILFKKTKKMYRKIKRIVRKYIRMLIRHTKAHDYTILIYSILVLLFLIFIIWSLGKAFSGGEKEVKKTTEVTTEEPASDTDVITPEEEAKRQLALECKNVYERNKDFMMFVSQTSPVPENYEFEHHTLNSGFDIDKRILDDLKAMLEACNNAGFEYNIISAYRSIDSQKEIYDETLNRHIEEGLSEEEAKKETAKYVQLPGCSEHQTGLAIDISGLETTSLDQYVKDDPINKWLMDNCHNFGFILRYPDSKISITNISFEPWHFRYVGKEAAAVMKVNDLSFEEFMDMVEYSKTF